MNGFVIVAGLLEQFLDRNIKWRRKKKEEAYVFSEAEKNDVLERAKSENWPVMPDYVVAATYDSEKDTTVVTGHLKPAYTDYE